MSRWIGLAIDPTAGGTTYDKVTDTTAPVAIPDPTIWIPESTATASPGSTNLDRNNENRGVRGMPAPKAYRLDPKVSFESRAYPKVVKPVISRALGRIGATSGGPSPRAITTPIETAQSNPLPALVAHVLREEQYEILTGVAINTFELDLAVDAEGVIRLSDGWGLYYDVTDVVPDPGDIAPVFSGYGPTYTIQNAIAYVGDAATRIDCLAGFTLSVNNNLIADTRSRYCAGENIRNYSLNGNTYSVWLPTRNKISSQTITGTLDFGQTRPDLELRHILADAQRFVIECSCGPAVPATTPAANEMMRITTYKQVFTDGGADPMVKDGDIRSSYTYGAFLDDSNRDLLVEFVSGAPVV